MSVCEARRSVVNSGVISRSDPGFCPVRWFASFGGSNGTVVILYFSSPVRLFASFGGKNQRV